MYIWLSFSSRGGKDEDNIHRFQLLMQKSNQSNEHFECSWGKYTIFRNFTQFPYVLLVFSFHIIPLLFAAAAIKFPKQITKRSQNISFYLVLSGLWFSVTTCLPKRLPIWQKGILRGEFPAVHLNLNDVPQYYIMNMQQPNGLQMRGKSWKSATTEKAAETFAFYLQHSLLNQLRVRIVLPW